MPRPPKAALQRHQRARRQGAEDEPLHIKVAHDWLQDSEFDLEEELEEEEERESA